MKSYFPAIIWSLIILVLSGYPGNYVPEIPVWQFDKLVHSFIYTILSLFLMLAIHKQYIKNQHRFLLGLGVILVSSFYGGFMEFLQDYIFINRSGNWYDFMANTIGAILGVLIYPLSIRILPINRWFEIK